MISHWSLSDYNPPQVTRTLLSIMADLNNVIVWMVSTCTLISRSSSHLTNLLGIVPSVPTTIGITVTIMVHIFKKISSARSWYLSLFSLSFIFTRCSASTAKSANRSLFCGRSLGLVVWPRLGDPFVSQYLREVCASHCPGRILACT